MKDELVAGATGCAVCVLIVLGAATAFTIERRARPPSELGSVGILVGKLPAFVLPTVRYEAPKNERLQFLKMELRLRSRCDAEEGVFLWSGTEDQPMRCWSDVCVRREEGCLGTDIIWEVDPETDDFYRSGGY